MRNLVDAYANAVSSWIATMSKNNLNRTIAALDGMQKGTYGGPEFAKDVYAWLRDVADFRAFAALGIIPVASLDISSLGSGGQSNFVQAPAGSFASLALTPVANPLTNKELLGLTLDANNGDNSVRVDFIPATLPPGYTLTGSDKNALFQGGIFNKANDELIALVAARTHLP